MLEGSFFDTTTQNDSSVQLLDHLVAPQVTLPQPYYCRSIFAELVLYLYCLEHCFLSCYELFKDRFIASIMKLCEFAAHTIQR